MFKEIGRRVWAFDLEWVPDPALGRRLHGLDEEATDLEAMQALWAAAGASEEKPQPFVKTMLSRVVSVACVERWERPDGEVVLRILKLPHDPADGAEATVVGGFLGAVGKFRPQLVGFNSRASDMRILVQRALALGLSVPGFARRPNKPWEGIDYFSKASDDHFDLADLVGWGRGMPSLHELATACGIPGKLGVDGAEVAQLWLDGGLADIVAYNELDALTTYLVWLRAAHFGGFFDDEAYEAEQDRVRQLLGASDAEHHQRFLAAWQEAAGS